jgi:hypothetical protein
VANYIEKDAATIRSLLDPKASPPVDSDYLFVLYALIMRVKGEAVTGSDVHDAWSAWMQLRSPEHGSIVPFEDLPRSLQDEDIPYVEAIRKAASTRGAGRKL